MRTFQVIFILLSFQYSTYWTANNSNSYVGSYSAYDVPETLSNSTLIRDKNLRQLTYQL